MAYGIWIERQSPEGHLLPIAYHEWVEAVEEAPGVRLRQGGFSRRDPRSGASLKMDSRSGDAEVYDPQREQWDSMLLWTASGRACLHPSPSFNEEDDPLRQVVRELAKRLQAKVVGDQGEEYP